MVHKQQLVVTDNNTGRRFLADTGAHVSVVHSSWLDKRSIPSDQHLQTANGTSIATYGTRNVLLHLDNHRYSARLVITDVKLPLLVQISFINTTDLWMDVRGQRLIEADTYLSVSCDVTVTPVSQLAPIEIAATTLIK